MAIQDEVISKIWKFRKIAFLILLSLLSTLSIFAQPVDQCGFKPELIEPVGENIILDGTNTPPWDDPALLPDRLTLRTLKLVFYRVLKSDHTGFDLSVNEINSLVEEINQFFLPVHIQFNLLHTEIIYNDTLAGGGSMQNAPNDPNCINVYLIQSFPNPSQYGVTATRVMALVNPVFYKNIRITQGMGISHELGHYLGLYHTFQRDIYKIENITRIDTPTCFANHKIMGDAISDTEADDNGQGLTDNCGYSNYNRPRHNIMSYNPFAPFSFTNQQGRVMHFYIELLFGKQAGVVSQTNLQILDESNNTTFAHGGIYTKLNNYLWYRGSPKYLFSDITYKSSVLVENRILSGKQHLNWDDNNLFYQLNSEFTPAEDGQNRLARYNTPITATFSASALEGAAISSAPYLSDPWFADVNGNQDLGLLPVSGAKNVFKDVAYNPFNPNEPYYQIKADEVTASNGLSLSFQNWATTGTGSINTVQTTIQPIKITTNNAAITANYKAMLASLSTGWVGNQFVANNGTSSVMYVSDGKLWLHRENGSDKKEILVSSSAGSISSYSVTANGNNRYWVLNNGTTTPVCGYELNGVVGAASVPSLSGLGSNRIDIVRLNSATPQLALITKIGSTVYKSIGTLTSGVVSWGSWTPLTGMAPTVQISGNGNVAFVSWINGSSVLGYRLNSDGSWSAMKVITSSSSGSFTSLATAANGSNGLDLVLVRANSQTNKKDLAVSAWNADNTTLPLTVLSTSTTYGDFKAVSLSSNSGLKLASVGVSTYVPNYSYYLWKHDHTSWSQEASPFSVTEQKLFHQEVTFMPSKATVGALEVMTPNPVNWGGMTKITTGTDEQPVLSISGVQVTDTLIYNVNMDPGIVDSIIIDTLGVWSIAVKGSGFVTETVNDLKLFGSSELIVSTSESGTSRTIKFKPNLVKWDVWVVDPSGNKVRMGKENRDEELGSESIQTEVAVYPNPFNPETRINIRLAEPAELKVRVYNVVGQLVADLAKGHHDSGDYSFRFDGKSLASGTYFYRVEIGEKVKTGKLQLLK